MPAPKIIGIDPGLGRTAAAWIEDGEPRVAAVSAPKRGSLQQRCEGVLDRLCEKIPMGWTIYMEQPTARGSAKGAAVSPEVLTLGILVGYLTAGLIGEGCDVVLITPNRWKGSTPKEVTKQRVLRKWPELGLSIRSNDEYDSLGILLWALKHWKDA